MLEYSASKIWKKKDGIREVALGKVVAHLCLTLIINELKISVEWGRVVTTLNILFSVVPSWQKPLDDKFGSVILFLGQKNSIAITLEGDS